MPPSRNDGTPAKWDLGLKIFQVALTLVSVLVGVWTFSSQQRTNIRLAHDLQLREDSIHFAREVWMRRSALCSDLVTLASRTAVSASDSAVFEENAREFEEKYWGSGIFLSDPEVIGALKQFHIEVIDHRLGQSSLDRLRIRADRLSGACNSYLLERVE